MRVAFLVSGWDSSTTEHIGRVCRMAELAWFTDKGNTQRALNRWNRVLGYIILQTCRRTLAHSTTNYSDSCMLSYTVHLHEA